MLSRSELHKVVLNAFARPQMMKGELLRYTRRQVHNVLEVSGDDQVCAILLLLKLLESFLRSSMADLKAQLRSLQPPAHGGGGHQGGGSGEWGAGGGGRGGDTEEPKEAGVEGAAQAATGLGGGQGGGWQGGGGQGAKILAMLERQTELLLVLGMMEGRRRARAWASSTVPFRSLQINFASAIRCGRRRAQTHEPVLI